VITITGDHTTPIRVGDHTFEPVPFAVTSLDALRSNLSKDISVSKEILHLRDHVTKYDEISCASGVLGRFSGAELIGILKRFRDSLSELK